MNPDGQSDLVPTLADLIATRRSERGWSYRHLQERSGDVIKSQRWQQLGTGVRIKEFPEPASIQAIADALEIGVDRVLLAAARSIGLEVRGHRSELASMLPAGADRLTQAQRDAVLAVIRSMVNPSGEIHATEDEEPQQEQGSPADGDEAGEGVGRGAPIELWDRALDLAQEGHREWSLVSALVKAGMPGQPWAAVPVSDGSQWHQVMDNRDGRIFDWAVDLVASAERTIDDAVRALEMVEDVRLVPAIRAAGPDRLRQLIRAARLTSGKSRLSSVGDTSLDVAALDLPNVEKGVDPDVDR